MQAAYHGVPIVGLPFSGDQPDNAAKVVAKVFHSPLCTQKCLCLVRGTAGFGGFGQSPTTLRLYSIQSGKESVLQRLVLIAAHMA